MPSLAALVLASPLFGLTLQPPSADLATVSLVADLHAIPSALLLQDEFGEDGEAQADDESQEAQSDEAANADGGEDDAKAKEKSAEEAEYRKQVKRRISLTKVHRPLGLATWGAMTVTVALGVIQYYNLYGFFADQGSNPCVKGDAIFGQGTCTGLPWPHAVAAGVTTGLYAATFTVSLMMPDPDDLAHTKGAFGDTLRLHKTLRWVHFGGMLAQIALGIVIANSESFGLDRANDYGTLQTLATVHLAAGLVTYGALSWAGALMTF
jgi:hypothetical protein